MMFGRRIFLVRSPICLLKTRDALAFMGSVCLYAARDDRCASHLERSSPTAN